MNEIVALLKSEILALNVCLEKIRALKESVRKADDAPLLKTLTKAAEASLTELSNTATAKENFLKERKTKSIEKYLEAQELQKEREVAVRLLNKAKFLEKELSKELIITRELLKRSSAFVDFRINVMASVKADATYGPPGKNSGDATAKKMFDANV